MRKPPNHPHPCNPRHLHRWWGFLHAPDRPAGRPTLTLMTPDQKRDLNRLHTGRRVPNHVRAEFHHMGLVYTDMYGSVGFTHDGMVALQAIRDEANP